MKPYTPTEQLILAFGPALDGTATLASFQADAQGNALCKPPLWWRLKIALLLAIGHYRQILTITYAFKTAAKPKRKRSTRP